MSKLGRKLIKAAEEALAIADGTADPRSYNVHVPADLDVRAIRTGMKLSQAQFAAKFGLPAATVRDWEQNRRQPEGPARVLLTVIMKEPDAVSRALAIGADTKLLSTAMKAARKRKEQATRHPRNKATFRRGASRPSVLNKPNQ
jgi:putative transcriptional regulator